MDIWLDRRWASSAIIICWNVANKSGFFGPHLFIPIFLCPALMGSGEQMVYKTMVHCHCHIFDEHL